MIHIAYVALGSNLGKREENIHRAVGLLPPRSVVTALSPLMEYAAVDSPPEAPAFLNAAARLETELTARDLLDQLLDIEFRLGRRRSIRNAPRIIDLDLLLYDGFKSEDKHLLLPHPRMTERRFVLEPLAAIAPDLVHPIMGRSIRQLLEKLSIE